MNILLTGCAGFVGSRVGTLLAQEGHDVIGIDNLNHYYNPELKKYRISLLNHYTNFKFYKIDIQDKDSLACLFKSNRFDAVINLAARAGVRASIEDPDIYVATNTQGTLNLLELMSQYKVKQFVLASTSSLYANAQLPFTESCNVTKPISPYAATKLAAEALSYVWHHLHQINVAVLRYFTVYGPAGRPDMSVFRFIEATRQEKPIEVYGDGEQTRDFTYIDDIAKGTVAALKIKGYEIINLGGSNEPISINKLISITEKELNKKATINYLPANNADMSATQADITKANKLLQWTPKVSPIQGIKQTIEWHLKNKSLLDKLF